MSVEQIKKQAIIDDFQENPLLSVRARAKKLGVSEYLVRRIIYTAYSEPKNNIKEMLLDMKAEFYLEQKKMLDLIYKLFDIALEEPIVGPRAQKAKEFLLKQKA